MSIRLVTDEELEALRVARETLDAIDERLHDSGVGFKFGIFSHSAMAASTAIFHLVTSLHAYAEDKRARRILDGWLSAASPAAEPVETQGAERGT